MSFIPINYMDVKEGDIVTRMLAGAIPMKLRVTNVDDKLIYCGIRSSLKDDESSFQRKLAQKSDDSDENAWTFDRETGVEIDHDLGWGPQYGITGSYLKEVEPGT